MDTGLLVMVVAGLVCAGFGGWLLHDQTQQLETFEPVDAELRTAEVDHWEEYNDGRYIDTYAPEVSYSYVVDGQRYTSENFRPGTGRETFRDRAEAAALLDGYEAGQQVTAYVDPQNPEQAFLSTETGDAPYYFIGFGGLFAFAAGVGLLRDVSGR